MVFSRKSANVEGTDLFRNKVSSTFVVFKKEKYMDTFLEALSTKNARTANGAITNSTSLNKCLDFFSIAGNPRENIESFEAAFGEDPQLAMRILFWSRDCRGGAGARRNFITIMKKLQIERPVVFSKVFKFIPEFGYWKDVYHLEPTLEVTKFIADTLINESDHSLCAKYCPRKGVWFYLLRKNLKMTPSEFRHFIVSKTQVVENLMCANKWDSIKYEQVPSVAGLRYKNTFIKHDGIRYNQYIQSVLDNKTKINSSVLYPNDIYHNYRYQSNGSTSADAIKAMWNNLPNFMEGCKDRILPVCDVSGSMTGTPMEVSVALGCYISERNEGPFKDAFITFSSKPELQILSGDIISRFRQLRRAPWGMNTNLQAVFNLILRRAQETHMAQELMPTKLLIISDMQFDCALGYNQFRSSSEPTNFEAIKAKYTAAGYEMPGIIFWNVNGNAGNVPVTMRDQNVGLVSGYSPSILKSVLQAKVLSPMELMLNTVNTERYSVISL